MPSVTFSDSYYISGYGDTSTAVRVNYSEQSYNVSTNKTTVKITSIEIYCSRQVSGPVYGTLRIGGSAVVSFSGGYSNTASPSAGSYADISGFSPVSVSVAHNELGAASMSVGLSGGSGGVFGISYNGKMFGVHTSVSKSVALTTHPRASTISSCPAAAETGSTVTLTVSRNSSAFYHKAAFLVGNTTLYTTDAFSTSVSYTIPRAWFVSAPNSASLDVTVSVRTYTDQSCTTAVGSPATAQLCVTPDPGMKPVLSPGWAVLAPYNGGAAAGMSGYIKGFSRAEASFDASKIDLSDTAGAAIASFSVACQGETDGESPYLTPLLSSTAVTVVCSVTDSRGRTASESFVLSVMDYAAPSISGIEIFRCAADGTADENGTYTGLKASLSFSPVGAQNSCALSVAIAPSGGAYGAETSLASGVLSVLGPTSPDRSYNVRFSAADDLGGSAVYYDTLPTREWAVKFRPNGRGVAFGKAAETDAVFEIADGWAVKSRGIVDLIYPVGSLYLSVGSASPAVLFGGTWEQIRDRFLLAAGDSFSAGETGGAAAHRHTTGNFTLTVNEIPSHYHKASNYKAISGWEGDSPGYFLSDGRQGSSTTTGPNTGSTGGGRPHNHGDTGDASSLPPYLAVYIWKRTA